MTHYAIKAIFANGAGGIPATWHEGKDLFVNPRRDCLLTDGNKNISVVVDSLSLFAKSLREGGSIENWKHAYELVKKSPVANKGTKSEVVFRKLYVQSFNFESLSLLFSHFLVCYKTNVYIVLQLLLKC